MFHLPPAARINPVQSWLSSDSCFSWLTAVGSLPRQKFNPVFQSQAGLGLKKRRRQQPKSVQRPLGNRGFRARFDFAPIASATLSPELPQSLGARTVRAAERRKILWRRILGNLRAENSCPQYMNYPDWNFFLLEHLRRNMLITIYRERK